MSVLTKRGGQPEPEPGTGQRPSQSWDDPTAAWRSGPWRRALRKPGVIAYLAALVLLVRVAASAGQPAGVDAADMGGPAAPSRLVAYQQDSCPEPNDGFAQACPITPPARVNGFISSAQDLDTYIVRITSPARIVVALTALPVDYDVHLYTATAALMQESQQEGLADEIIEVDLDTPGNYYVFVNSGRGDFSPTAPYLLVVDLLPHGGGEQTSEAPDPAANMPPAPTPTPTAPAPAASAPVSGRIQSVSGGRAAIRRADGSIADGAPPGTIVGAGDSIASVGSGEVVVELIGGSLAVLAKDSAFGLVRADQAADGTVAVQLDVSRGRVSNRVGPANRPGSFYAVTANRIETIARGTTFDVTLRDDGTVLVDCADCDRSRVTAGGRPLGSGERLAFLPSGEVQHLKIYDEPNVEPTPEPEEEREKYKS